jgi:hypothetical protein
MPHRARLAGILALVTAGALVLPRTATAQFELAPTIGMYLPLGGWTQITDGGTGFAMQRRHLSAHIWGARLSSWPGERVGIEGYVGFTPSQVAVSTADGTTDVRAGVVITSARLMYKLATLQDGHQKHEDARLTWDVLLGVGGGILHRYGNAWENTSGVTAPALVLMAGLRTKLSGSMTWRVSLEDYVSWAQFDRGLPSQTRGRTHHDLLLSLAIVMRLGGGS